MLAKVKIELFWSFKEALLNKGPFVQMVGGFSIFERSYES